MTDEWKRLNRELKILLAKQATGSLLSPKDQERLTWLQERLGAAEEVKRIHIDEDADRGPKIKTSQDHYATEVPAQLINNAEEQKLEKHYEKDLAPERKAIEVDDFRTGAETFQQEGLSNFAIAATEDMRAGEISLSDQPGEEAEPAKKTEYGQVVYAQDESERLTQKNKQDPSNPYALNVADNLAQGLDQVRDYDDSAVPDTAAKSFSVDIDEEDDQLTIDEPVPAPMSEMRELMKQTASLQDEQASHGEKTSHQISEEEVETLDSDLLMQAVYEQDQVAAKEPDASAEQVSAEQFWGLSDSTPTAEVDALVPTPVEEPEEEETVPPPPPSIAIPEPIPEPPPEPPPAARPLPNLSFTPGPAPLPEQTQTDTSPPASEKESDDPRAWVDDLFESEQPPEAAPVSRPAPPKPVRPPPPAEVAPKQQIQVEEYELTGPRRVTVHFKDGVSRRGTIQPFDIDADTIRLDAQAGSHALDEDLVTLALKAIFLLLPRGAPYPPKAGTPVRVVLIDDRELEGTSPDYDPRKKAFTLFPKIDRGKIERIIVFNDAVKNIWFDEETVF